MAQYITDDNDNVVAFKRDMVEFIRDSIKIDRENREYADACELYEILLDLQKEDGGLYRLSSSNFMGYTLEKIQ